METAGSAPTISKKKDRLEVKKILVRAREAEHQSLKERAAAANLSLNDYLIECGLSIGYDPDPRERELRERAVFEIRKAGYNLDRLVKRLGKGGASDEQVENAAREIAQAVQLLTKVYPK